VMTSATLDIVDAPLPFQQFRGAIGLLGDNYAAEFSGSFAPRKFGAMRFMLPDPAVPVPNRRYADAKTEDLDDDMVQASDPEWLDYVSQGVTAAARRGGRTLVLTTSFRDTGLLVALLREQGFEPIEHRRGQRLADAIDELKRDPAAILLSPAAWEGVNLPGLLTHLVIPRLPFAPVDSAGRQAMLDSLASRGWGQKDSEQAAYRSALYAAQRRFRQGIGRAIRTATDDVTVWILDPRFPLPQAVCKRVGIEQPTSRFQGFDRCIPTRFRSGIRSALRAAEIFGSVGH
jgi:ATP-dependent DNA helicase DinG